MKPRSSPSLDSAWAPMSYRLADMLVPRRELYFGDSPGYGQCRGALVKDHSVALVYDTQRLKCEVEVLLYTDDILLMFQARGRRAMVDV